MRSNPVRQAFLSRPLHHYIKHLLLQVDSENLTCIPDKFCQPKSEIAHTATNIHDSHSFLYIAGENFLWIVNQAAQSIIKCIGKPPGADMMIGHNNYINVFLK